MKHYQLKKSLDPNTEMAGGIKTLFIDDGYIRAPKVKKKIFSQISRDQHVARKR